MKSTVVFVAACAAAVSAASAQITIYTTQASFNAATSAQGVDTFNDVGTVLISSPVARTAGSYGYTVSATNNLFGAGSAADAWMSTNTATSAMVFDGFGSGVFAAGGFFFTSDISGAYLVGDINVTATDASGSVTQLVVNSQTGSFVGFSSPTGIISVTVQSVQPTSGFAWPTANDFTLAVPTPGAAAALSLGAAAGLRRRRR